MAFSSFSATEEGGSYPNGEDPSEKPQSYTLSHANPSQQIQLSKLECQWWDSSPY